MIDGGWGNWGRSWLGGALLLAACSGGASDEVEVSEASPDEAIAENVESPLQAKNALSTAQSRTVLKLIDDICGDTWCSGDYDFGFRRLTCATAARTCTLTLQVFPREGVPSSEKSYWRSCKTHDFRGFASLVDTGPNGYQSLTSRYYDALTECTSRVVGHLK